MLAAIDFPSWLKPEIIPGLPFRWYGLMYVVAFGVAWLLFNYESKRRKAPWSEDDAAGYFFWAILGVLVGARLFGTLVYNWNSYWYQPWLIFWPFGEDGRFSGFQGMSFHGGFVGVIVATAIYCKLKKQAWLAWADVISVCVPLGYTAGRLGNFINGELWGKVTDSPIGMVFPTVPDQGRFDGSLDWVREIADKAGIVIGPEPVNLPRFPSQLFEAAFEGIVLWLILWFLVRKRKSFVGFATGCYAIGYGVIRFVIEYFREPDMGMGYVLPLGNPNAPIFLFTTPLNFSMGQVLCLGMIALGILVMVYGSRTDRIGRSAEGSAGSSSASKESRKLRKRLR